MNNNKEQTESQRDTNDFSKGPHIAHKSPAEDADLATNEFVQQTEKPRQKVDRGTADDSEKPAQQS